MRAELLVELAKAFGKLPREIEEEDVSLLQTIAIASMGAKEAHVSS